MPGGRGWLVCTGVPEAATVFGSRQGSLGGREQSCKDDAGTHEALQIAEGRCSAASSTDRGESRTLLTSSRLCCLCFTLICISSYSHIPSGNGSSSVYPL